MKRARWPVVRDHEHATFAPVTLSSTRLPVELAGEWRERGFDGG